MPVDLEADSALDRISPRGSVLVPAPSYLAMNLLEIIDVVKSLHLAWFHIGEAQGIQGVERSSAVLQDYCISPP